MMTMRLKLDNPDGSTWEFDGSVDELRAIINMGFVPRHIPADNFGPGTIQPGGIVTLPGVIPPSGITILPLSWPSNGDPYAPPTGASGLVGKWWTTSQCTGTGGHTCQ